MFFNSIHFLIFMPLVTLVYFLLRGGSQRVFLLACSFYFYCVFSVKLSLLMVFSTVLDYTVARIIDGSSNPRVRKAALAATMTGNLGVLATFKYLDFFSGSLAELLGFRPWPALNLILPMGISFYTFETMSYTIDVYRGKLAARKSIIDVALFVTFFPHLVAGPIMRGQTLLPQFAEKHEPNSERILSGALLIVWGLLKKVFVADPMGAIADSVYGTAYDPVTPGTFSGLALLMGTYAFAVQIYCDFSAYSTIAIGAGRVLGFRIMQNFDSPYLATTIREFWRRWHISLSTWLRDYLYIPLGGSRGSNARTYVNLAITMLLGGLWHGAAWTFVIWGALHGLYLAGERFLGIDQLERTKMSLSEKWIRGIVTFHLVCLTWVFFRARGAEQAFSIIGRIVTWADGDRISSMPLVMLLILVGVQTTKYRVNFGAAALRVPNVARWGVYASVLLLIVALAGARSPEFIYFQF